MMLASESVAIEGTGHKATRDVAPGEAIFIDLQGRMHARQCAENPSLNPCMFEYVYLARPDSVMDGVSVYQARLNLGETLAQRVINTCRPARSTSSSRSRNPAAPAPCSWRTAWASPTAKAS
jgi:amidophosphoribosyltransferase